MTVYALKHNTDVLLALQHLNISIQETNVNIPLAKMTIDEFAHSFNIPFGQIALYFSAYLHILCFQLLVLSTPDYGKSGRGYE